MADGLYEHDVLAWSEQQAATLRRLAAGERVNDSIDWPHLIEEVEDLGRSELRACESLLVQALLHLLKITALPEDLAVRHWQVEAFGFLADARRAFSPSMRQRLDLAALHADALARARLSIAEPEAAAALPDDCPFTLDDLIGGPADLAALLARLV